MYRWIDTQRTDRIVTQPLNWPVEIRVSRRHNCRCPCVALLLTVYRTCSWFKCCAWRGLCRLRLQRSGRRKTAEEWSWTPRTRCVLASYETSTTPSTWNTWHRTNDLMRCWHWNTLFRSRFLGVLGVSQIFSVIEFVYIEFV